MAKDGTARGGKRPGQGRPSKALKDKVENGNPGHRPLKVVDQSGKVKERVAPLPKAPALPKVAALPEAPEITVEEGVARPIPNRETGIRRLIRYETGRPGQGF